MAPAVANMNLMQLQEQRRALHDATDRSLALARQREQVLRSALKLGLVQAQERLQAVIDGEQTLLDAVNCNLIQAQGHMQSVIASASTLARRQRQAVHDTLAGPVIQELRAQAYGWKACAQRLTSDGIPAPRGGRWSAIAVRRIAERLGAAPSGASARQVRPGMKELDSGTNRRMGGQTITGKPITYISINLGRDADAYGFLVGVRVVPAGRDGETVFGRTLNHGEPDTGEGIIVQQGERLMFPSGSIKVTIQDADRTNSRGPDGYATIANLVWAWLNIPPFPNVELLNYFFAVARRLDSAYSLCVGAISKISTPPDHRARYFGALSDAELTCIGLNCVDGMIKSIATKFSVATTVPHEIDALLPAVKAIEALSKSKQLEFSTSGILRYGNHSLDLRAQVIPALVAARKFILDAMVEKTAVAKTIKKTITFFDTTKRGVEFHNGSGTIPEKSETTWDKQLIRWKRNELDLPKTKSPIRFAVQMKNGLTSNAWGVRAQNTGDAYIYCRDNMRGQKVSLHASGKQHISFDKNAPGMERLTGSRFMNQWQEPEYEREAIATFKLLFPSWGIGLNAEQRNTSKSTWDKNHILVESHDELLTIVSFVIIDDDKTLRRQAASSPMSLLGVLQLRRGKKLCVVAGWQPEGNLRTIVERAVKKIRIAAEQVVPADFSGKDLSLCLTGFSSTNSAYMVAVPAKCDVGPGN